MTFILRALMFPAFLLWGMADWSGALAQTPLPSAPAPRLSEEQLAWASGRVIRVASDPSFAPFSEIDAHGMLHGVDSQILDAISTHTGLKFQTVPFPTWTEAWQALADGDVDMVTGCAATEERSRTALFTRAYAHPRLAIVAHRDAGQGWSVEDLAGLTLAIPRGYVQLDDIRERVPDLRLTTCSNFSEALALINSGQADATIMSLATAVALLPQAGFKDLRVTGFYDRDFPLRLAVRKDQASLLEVLDIALAALQHQSAGAAYADWIDARLDEWSDQGRQLRHQRYWLVGLSALTAALASAAALVWWRARRRGDGPGGPPGQTHTPPAASGQLLGTAFDLTSIPMLVVQPPDLILDRNAIARTLLNGTMVLPPELSAVVARLSALPPESPELVEWAPPGQPPKQWHARLLPLPDGRCLLTLVH